MRRLTVLVLLIALVGLVPASPAAGLDPPIVTIDRTVVVPGSTFSVTVQCPAGTDGTGAAWGLADSPNILAFISDTGRGIDVTFFVPITAPGSHRVVGVCFEGDEFGSESEQFIDVVAGNPPGWIAEFDEPAEPTLDDESVVISGRCVQPGATGMTVYITAGAGLGDARVFDEIEAPAAADGTFSIELPWPAPFGAGRFDLDVSCFSETTTSTQHSFVGFAEWHWVLVHPSGFADVPPWAFFNDAVVWSARCGVSNGTEPGFFSPDRPLTRIELVVLLHRLAGSPTPTTDPADLPFTDLVGFGDDAVAWAFENGITLGLTATTFGPNALLDRAQVVTLLWRSIDSPVPGVPATFVDIPLGAFYALAVAWAAEVGVTGGISDSEFGPGLLTSRSQVVTFLFRMDDSVCPAEAT